MLTLTLWNTAETTQHTIELYQHAPVNLNYQFTDVTNINKAVGSYSQTFRVPATKANTDFFGDIKNPAINSTSGLIEGRYSTKRKIRAALSYNSIPMMTGYVQIKAVYIQKKDFADIELVFFGDSLDMATKIGDKMLSDLADTSMNHTLNITAITNSWAGSSAAPFDGTLRYGLIDKGQNFSGADAFTGSPLLGDGRLLHGDFTPFVRIRKLLSLILSEAGFTYTSSFIDGSSCDNIYMPAYAGSKTPRSEDYEPESELFGVSIGSNFTLSNTDTHLTMRDDYTSEGGYDYSNNWFNSSYQFNAPYDGFFTFTINAKYTMGGATVPYYKVSWNGWSNGGAYAFYTWPDGSTTRNGDRQDTFTIFFPAGSRMKIFVGQAGTATGNVANDGAVGNNDAFWLRLVESSEPVTGQDVDLSSNYPQVKQIDFLMGLQKMFNLVFVPDKNKPNHILIEPFADYTASGTKKDWSNKIDYSKDVVVKPTNDLQRKRYEWTHSEGQDFINVLVKQQTDRVYGRYEVTDPQNDFATGDITITSPFAPYLMSNVPSTNVIMHRCITNDGSGVQDPKPRIAFWNGQSAAMGTIEIMNTSLLNHITENYPVFSNYNEVAPTITGENLNFGYERDFFYVQVHPLNTLYYKYWSPYVNELYTSNARHVTAFFKLTRADIQDFEFSDKIYINNTYYRILKISNFDATKEGITKVELLKVGTDVADCAHIPTQIGTNGVIRFNGSGINYGSEECCVKYGYIWRPRLGRCYAAGSQAIPPSVT